MYLDKILGTTTKVNALFHLIQNREKRFVEKELAGETRLSLSELNRQMPVLVSSGLVSMQRLGTSKVYSINQKHFLFKPLQQLFVDLNKVLKKAAVETAKFIAMRSKTKICCVLLIGSVARKTVRQDIVAEPSDIDLVIIAKEEKEIASIKKQLINFVNTTISKKYGLIVYPIFFSLNDFLIELKQNNCFVINSLKEGVVLHGKKPRRFS